MKSTTLPLGTAAPEFTLPGADDRLHRLAEHRGRKVVLVFYRAHG